jgi:hypothetical protein
MERSRAEDTAIEIDSLKGREGKSEGFFLHFVVCYEKPDLLLSSSPLF